jgi:hypothetical protein
MFSLIIAISLAKEMSINKGSELRLWRESNAMELARLIVLNQDLWD